MKKDPIEKKLKDIYPIEEKPRLGKDILQTSMTILVLIAICFLLLRFVAQRIEVSGDSMMTTLYDNDQLLVDKFTYNFLHGPERYDIVVFRIKDEPHTFYIKRVIGLPGETVQIVDSVIYINGVPIDDPYPSEKMGNKVFPSYLAQDPITLGEGEYFVLGDNRNNSTDSRFTRVGKVQKSQLIGRAVFRFAPLDVFGSLEGK